MEKRNSLLLTVIAIATLLVAVIGATFAYFATTQNLNANVPINVNTPSAKAAFTAVAGNEINISVDAYKMQQGENTTSDVTTTDDLTSDSSLTIKLNAATEGLASQCKYDIIFTWTSDTYALSTDEGAEQKHYFPTADALKEFTIEATPTTTGTGTTGSTTTSVTETNIDKFPTGTRKITVDSVEKDADYFTIVDDAIVTTTGKENGTDVVWNFKVRFYNLTKDQSLLMGRKFSGIISVNPDSVEC